MVKRKLGMVGKSAFRILTLLRSKQRRRLKISQHFEGRCNKPTDCSCLETDLKNLSQSRYAKFIPSKYFAEEKVRSNCFPMDLNYAFEDKKHVHGKHKLIFESLARLVKEEVINENSAVKKNFKELERMMKVTTACYNDKDLLAMIATTNELLKTSKSLCKGKISPKKANKLFTKQFYSYQAKTRGNTNCTSNAEGQDKATMSVHTDNVDPPERMAHMVEHSSQKKHSCDVQKCLLNTTPRKNSRKSIPHPRENKVTNKPMKESNHPTDARDMNRDQDCVTNLLNFTYRESKGSDVYVETSRLNSANEKHCKVVAELLNERLRGSTPMNKHLVCVYADLTDGSNSDMSKLKYDMLSLCLNTFFFPRKDSVYISWTVDTRKLISKATGETCVRDIFGHRQQLSDCSLAAVMVVSSIAADMLRHQQLCVLDSMSEVLGLSRVSLLIVHADVAPQLFV